MKINTLLLAIIQSEDAEAAILGLTQASLSVTRMSTTGGFLQTSNVTLLVGLESVHLSRAIAVLKETCHQRLVFVNTATHAGGVDGTPFIAPLEAQIGGATIFTVSIERFIQMGPHFQLHTLHPQPGEDQTMKLVMMIMPEEMSSNMLSTLTNQGYRATLISTTGGFRRKGNATLMIGTESDRVDSLLEAVHEICYRAGLNDSCATIFIMNVDQYVRV